MEDIQLLQKLGVGSYSIVYKARRRSTGEILAVKQLKDASLTWEAVTRMPEVVIGGRFAHPNICRLHGVVRVKSATFMLMEYAESNLLQHIARVASSGGSMDESEVRCVMKQVLTSLATLHASGIAHRDLKPENILLSSTGRTQDCVKLCDLGQARCMPPATGSGAALTAYVSTRWYRAPELLLHELRYSTGVDLFAAGMVMAEMLSLRTLAPGTSEADQLFRLTSLLGPIGRDYPDGMRLAAAAGYAPSSSIFRCTPVGIAAAIGRPVSPSAVAMLEGLLRFNPASRWTASEALSSAWMREGVERVPRGITPPLLSGSEEALARADAAAAAAELEAALSTPTVAAAAVPVDTRPASLPVAPVAAALPPSRRRAVPSNPLATLTTSTAALPVPVVDSSSPVPAAEGGTRVPSRTGAVTPVGDVTAAAPGRRTPRGRAVGVNLNPFAAAAGGGEEAAQTSGASAFGSWLSTTAQ